MAVGEREEQSGNVDPMVCHRHWCVSLSSPVCFFHNNNNFTLPPLIDTLRAEGTESREAFVRLVLPFVIAAFRVSILS